MSIFQQIKQMSNHSAALLLGLPLSADIALILLQIVRFFDPSAALCNIWGCLYGHLSLIKIFWIIILFLYLLKLTKYPGYLAWAALFTCFLIDDALWLHQKVGDRIAPLLAYYGLPSRFYELAVLAIAGLVLVSFVIWFYLHGPETLQKISMHMLIFLAAVFFLASLWI
jgi:hypothetical protein